MWNRKHSFLLTVGIIFFVANGVGSIEHYDGEDVGASGSRQFCGTPFPWKIATVEEVTVVEYHFVNLALNITLYSLIAERVVYRGKRAQIMG